MNTQVLIEAKKGVIVPELYEWAETFDFEYDEDGEKTMEPYNEVFDLAKRFENNKLRKGDYEKIMFHIEQINYNEINIQL